ncbi:hypothetical protein [Flavobacterium sp. 9]|uniref:hypothetical protein n=1 Tax=Flavobacterium sp. 9 TaxID=2035198 RepID=UPI000C19E93B|nr:hypothetical protein [Flavobacterium sp. 9]
MSSWLYFFAEEFFVVAEKFYRKARKDFMLRRFYKKHKVRKAGSIQSFANFVFLQSQAETKTLRALR